VEGVEGRDLKMYTRTNLFVEHKKSQDRRNVVIILLTAGQQFLLF